jgi:hypothetical protein
MAKRVAPETALLMLHWQNAPGLCGRHRALRERNRSAEFSPASKYFARTPFGRPNCA